MYVLFGFVECLHHRDALLPAADDIFGLLEQVIEHLGLVFQQRRDDFLPCCQRLLADPDKTSGSPSACYQSA